MADGTSKIKTFITLVLFIAVRLEAVTGQSCPVTDDRCICRNNFDDVDISCERLGNQDSVPPFLDSGITYNTLTINTDTTIRVVQDNAFANIGVRTLILSNLQIKSVAENAFRGKIETVLESLYLDGNDIADIPPATFRNLTNLKLLSVTSNKIAALSPETFRGLPSLTTVYLYLNELGSLPDGLFSDCASLNLLLLNGNKLSRLSEMSFGRLSVLEELQLQDNRIDSIEPGTFQLLSRLTILNLKSNAIQTVNASTLIGLQNLINLDLSNNNISIVPVDAFQQLQALKTLNLANNQIQAIEVETISNLRNLENLLDLSGNSLMSIPDYLFSNLSKLQRLYLSLNDIHFVNARTFNGLSSLSILSINNNSVQQLPVDLFQNTGNLTYLDLNGNSIHSIVPGTFDNCSKLVNIYLRDNKLDSISLRTFYGLPALQQLFLDHNDISYLESATFSNLPKISYIDLSFNNITGMDENAFVNISSLKTLLLDRNRLVSVPVDALKWLPNLSTLSLKWNAIVSIADNTFSSLRYLKRLELAYNSLESLETNAFAGLATLTTLLLQNNSICYIQPGLFVSFLNGSLGTLDLSSNCITDISGAFFFALGKLTALSLSDNNLTEISRDAFVGLNSVTDIELDFNTISFIDPFAFSNLNALSKLSMFGNRIRPEALIAIGNLPKLKTLQLGQNLIDAVPDDSFANCSSLTDLGLRNNSLRRIGRIDSVNTVIEKLDLGLNRLNSSEGIDDLAQFTNLRTLKLDGNGIDDALLGNATPIFQKNAISELDLSSNNLSSAVFSIIGGLTSLSTLRIDNNQIESLDQGSLSSLAKTVSILSAKNNLLTGSSLSPLANFSALNYLNLDGNQIASIPSGLFRSMFNLGTLSLNRNLLTEIRNDTFGELQGTISEIYLADNHVELVETGAILAITGIKQLDLSGNRLTTITLPESMPALLNLYLARNRLESFPLGLRSFRFLNSIDLSENRIRVLPPIDIYSTVQMRLLDFSKNQIENIDGMTYVGVIDRLNFSGNHISDVQTLIFRRVTSANHVDFSWNRFERVPASISASHATATVIDLALDFNNISNLSDWAGNGSLQPRIERMSLRGNRIAGIPRVLIESLNSSLIELDLRDNQLVSLEETTFANTVHLNKLDLEGNPLRCDCPLGWLRRLQLTVDVGLATCVTPEWFRGLMAVCYNISTCDGIDPALKTIDLNDTCFMWKASSVPQLFSTSLPTSTANTPDISTVTTVNWTVTTVNWTNQFTSFVFSSVPTDVHNATPIVQESSLPYNRDGLIAGLVCGGFALIVIIGCAAYWIKHRMTKKAQHVSTISNGMLYDNPGFSKI